MHDLPCAVSRLVDGSSSVYCMINAKLSAGPRILQAGVMPGTSDRLEQDHWLCMWAARAGKDEKAMTRELVNRVSLEGRSSFYFHKPSLQTSPGPQIHNDFLQIAFGRQLFVCRKLLFYGSSTLALGVCDVSF